MVKMINLSLLQNTFATELVIWHGSYYLCHDQWVIASPIGGTKTKVQGKTQENMVNVQILNSSD